MWSSTFVAAELMDHRAPQIAERLAALIRCKTVTSAVTANTPALGASHHWLERLLGLTVIGVHRWC
jgi:hypothetical protein